MKLNLYIVLALFLLTTCKKPEQLGPDISGIYGPVTVLEDFDKDRDNPDFAANEKLHFTAKFEKDAVWTITIVGNISGAVKTITGISKEIAIYNSSWDGTADQAPSFLLETATATLSFKNSPETFSTTINIATRKILDLPGDVLVSNFSVNKSQCYCAPPMLTTTWHSDWPATSNVHNSYGYPDGTRYMLMGPEAPWQGAGSPYVDILTIDARNADQDYGNYFPLYADPLKVYFNIMVYNTGTPTWMQISLIEDGEVARHIDIKPTWTGWRLLSFNYTSFVADIPGPPKPQKVNAVRFVLLSNTPIPMLPGPPVSAAFDHVTFTHNKPYQP